MCPYCKGFCVQMRIGVQHVAPYSNGNARPSPGGLVAYPSNFQTFKKIPGHPIQNARRSKSQLYLSVSIVLQHYLPVPARFSSNLYCWAIRRPVLSPTLRFPRCPLYPPFLPNHSQFPLSYLTDNCLSSSSTASHNLSSSLPILTANSIHPSSRFSTNK